MNAKSRHLLELILNETESPAWDGGLLKKEGSGHTWEVADLDAVHPGRDTACVYLLGKLLGNIDSETGTRILSGIAGLQVTDENHARYGAFRWYREETEPIDTNAAFFTLLPLAVLRLYEPGTLSDDEKSLIDHMLSLSYNWFSKECNNPILFYTNKIISDGAMLTAIGNITGDDRAVTESLDFLEKWLDYTENRGFGWGENMSPGYNGVTVQAFTVIRKCLGECEISERFEKIENGILETFRFHSGYEFVPAIRSYNVGGILKPWRILNNLAGVSGFGLADGFSGGDVISVSDLAKAMIIYGSRLYLDEADYSDRGLRDRSTLPAVRKTHIMDDAFAYSWLGENGGLGTINRFPVIEGSYQHKTWGLGWQCFPVSTIVYGGQVSFLRFNVDDGNGMRHHPHKDKHSCYLDPALFSENHYPDVTTDCFQEENTAIAIRSISRLRNKAVLVSDSFDVQRFGGRIMEINTDRQWIVLSYENAAICVSPLLGYTHGNDKATQGLIKVDKAKGDVRLVQTLYEGELRTLFDERLSAGWVLHFIDRKMMNDEIENYLSDIAVFDACGPDGFKPRQTSWNVQKTVVSFKDEEVLSFKHDPYGN